MTKKIILLLCIIGLTGCAAGSVLRTNAEGITVGATTKSVESVLGKPQRRQYNEPSQQHKQVIEWAWQYCTSTMSTDIYATVRFYKGIVTAVDTYEVKQRIKEPGKTCADYFKNIDWSGAPALQQ